MEANELFGIIEQLAVEGPTASGLRRMHEVLLLACAEGTKGQGGSFGNLFSQLDFVCKQAGIAPPDRVAMQTMRRHSNESLPPSSADWLCDLRALALLVSAVTHTGIPGSLRRQLPSNARTQESSGKTAEKRPYVRCIVRSWDERQFTASTADGEITVDYATTSGGRDFSYLGKLLREGMQLNLLDCDPRPSHIIVEPDFLVDISAVAACFTNYGRHPLHYTLNRLKPRPNTQAILLGNFAGTALDDVIHGMMSGEEKMVRGEGKIVFGPLLRSFKEQALRFCACEGFDAIRFKRDAAQQMHNIRAALKFIFPRLSPLSTQPSPLLEPSFVCERLGLQGRVDLMTTDMSLLVEQKAGKNMKIERESHDPHGRQQESHYVQLLLYYGILRYNFGRTDQSVDTRLLYSRYPPNQGLLAVNYYRTLFREALKLRNQIVATELFVAREGFGRILPLLNPSIIYKEVKPDGYFAHYVLPELSGLLAPLATLSPIERAYYEHMLTFVYREQLYQKLGGAGMQLQHGGGAASDLWQMSLAEKLLSGNIIDRLTIVAREKTDATGGYDLITLERKAQGVEAEEGALPNFRRGDMVWLYAYRQAPDACRSILYKGSLLDVGVDRFVVRLHDGQQAPDVFSVGDDRSWAVEHASSDLTTTAAIRGLHQFAAASPRRRSLLLAQRQPETDMSVSLSRSYSPFYDDLLLRACQARDYFLLMGPPGTGKTSQALRHLIREQLPACLLLTAYTNRAVDEICAMLEDEGHHYLRIGNEASCDPRFRHRLLENALASGVTTLEAMRQLIDRVAIVVATTTTLQSRQEILALKHFSLCIVDEASQILEPSIVGLLAHPAIDRFILIGDHKQLPAVSQCDEAAAAVSDPLLRGIGLTDCRQSLFERLVRWEQHEGRSQFLGLLDHQGRMHPEVAAFPCSHFYCRENLQAVPLPHQQEQGPLYDAEARDDLDRLLLSRRMLFLPVTETPAEPSAPAEPSTASSSLRQEARLVARLLMRIGRYYGNRFQADSSVGVIVPYRSQIALIRSELVMAGASPTLLAVSIDTVERYQGSQRDVIIYSFAVEHRYQLQFLTATTFIEDGRPIDRKLNVAMTRARRQLIIVGRSDILSQVPLFRELKQFEPMAVPEKREHKYP